MANTVSSMTSSAGSTLVVLDKLLEQGSLTCDLSDSSGDVAVLPMTFSWRSNPTPFFGSAHTVSAPKGDLDAVYEGIRTATPGCVLIVETGSTDRAVWGETTTHEALSRGVAGVVLDGACRDIPAVRASGLPIIARGVSPKRAVRTGRGSVGEGLQLYGVTILSHDLIVSDENGTVIVPQKQINALVEEVSKAYKEAKNGFNR